MSCLSKIYFPSSGFKKLIARTCIHIGSSFQYVWRKLCVLDCWKVWSAVPICVVRSAWLTITTLFSLAVLLVKFQRNLARLVDHLEKCGLFSDLKRCFRSFLSAADLIVLIVVLVFLTWLLLLEPFTGFGHASLLNKRKFSAVFGQGFPDLICNIATYYPWSNFCDCHWELVLRPPLTDIF